jgi:hypothetical protein
MLMTHDERISSYIDNEFSAEQEQEFLISLAASEGLRKSFRSELVLKKVLHHDEASVNPPRKLRGTVFASLGLAGAGLSLNKANATQSAVSRGMLKTFFATKMSTLVTVAGLSVSALAGFGVRAIVSPVPVMQVTHGTEGTQRAAPAVQNVSQPAIQPSSTAVTLNNPEEKKPSLTAKHTHLNHGVMQTPTEPVSGAAGGGTVSMEPPKINTAH